MEENSHQTTALVAGIVSGIMVGVFTIGQTIYTEIKANRRQRKTAEAAKVAAGEGAKQGAAEAIQPVADTVKVIDHAVNGKGEGHTGGTGLTARMERSEAWQKDHAAEDERRHGEVMGAIERVEGKL